MKILQVLDAFYPSVDGPVNVIVNIAKIAKEKGHEVELLVPKYPEIVDVEGIKVHRCKSIKAADGYRCALPMFDKSVKKLIKNGGFDIIHVHSPFMLGRAAIKYAKKYGVPTIFTMHTAYKSDFERVLSSKILQKFMMGFIMKTINSAGHMSSVSQGSATMLREYGYKGETIHVVRNGADMKPAEFDETLMNEIREKYDLKDKFTFLFVGRIVENKNIQFSLKVLKKIKESGVTNFKFLIVGSGAYEDGLKEIVSEYALEDNVVFVGRITDRNYLAMMYAVADLFMFPSVFDTCGIVAIEAAVNRLASAMIENCCASEVVEHRENGLSMPEDDEVWANEIIELMKNEEMQEKLKENAFNTIFVSWEKVIDKYIDLYDKIAKKEI